MKQVASFEIAGITYIQSINVDTDNVVIAEVSEMGEIPVLHIDRELLIHDKCGNYIGRMYSDGIGWMLRMGGKEIPFSVGMPLMQAEIDAARYIIAEQQKGNG